MSSGKEPTRYIKATMILDIGRDMEFADLDALADGIADLVDRLFPNHTGECLTLSGCDENGDAIGGRLHHHHENDNSSRRKR